MADPMPLSPRMVDCLREAATGLTDEGIATSLGISRHTVVTTLARARKRLGVPTTKAAVAAWIRSQEPTARHWLVWDEDEREWNLHHEGCPEVPDPCGDDAHPMTMRGCLEEHLVREYGLKELLGSELAYLNLSIRHPVAAWTHTQWVNTDQHRGLEVEQGIDLVVPEVTW